MSKEHLLENIKARKIRLENVSKEFLNDEEVIVEIMKHYGDQYRLLSPKMKKNRNVALAAITRWGQSLECAPISLKNDKEIVLAAIKNNGNNLQYASAALKADIDIALYAVEKNAYAYRYISRALKINDTIIRATLKAQGMTLHLMPDSIKSNEEYFALALKYNGAAYSYGIGKFVHKDEYIQIALEYPGNLPCMPAYIKDNKQVVLKEVSGSDNFKYASDRLKQDKDVIFAALNYNVKVFSELSESQRGDKEIFIAACRYKELNNFTQKVIYALDLTSKKIQSDIHFLIQCLSANMPVESLKALPKKLLENTQLVAKCLEIDKTASITLFSKLKVLKDVKPEDYIKVLKAKKCSEELEENLPTKEEKHKKIKI